MSLVRSQKDLPLDLSTVEAWIRRMTTQPHYLVLADAYEYNLWYIDSQGCFSYTDHILWESTPVNFLHTSHNAYCEAVIELLRRDRVSPYHRIKEDLQVGYATPKLLEQADEILHHANQGALTWL